MRDRDTPGKGLSRRQLLKLGAAGACALCLSTVPGCAHRKASRNEGEPGTNGKGFTRPVRARWFTRLDGGAVRCELCPRLCLLAEGERAPCLVRENRGGELYSLAHGNPALVQEDPVERKPFFHVVPGSRALSISTAGCNLACDFCEVWDMALAAPEDVHAYDMPPPAVVSQAQAAGVRALSYAFGEPVVFFEYMMEVAGLAREMGLLNLVHTAGYIRPGPLRELVGSVDAANVDLKSFDPGFYRDVVGGELGPVLENLVLLREAGVHTEITTLVIPTLNDDVRGIRDMCRWIARELGADVPVHFARFYPLYRLSNLPRTPVATLDRARDTALDEGLRFVYVAKVSGHPGENTVCPGCGDTVIRRMGFVIDEMSLEEGKCRCGQQVPGIWA